MYINEVNFNWNGALDYNNVPSFIVLHHAEWECCTIEDLHQCHLENGWTGVGYHYFVRKDGSVWKGRPDNAVGSHCKGSNYGSLGICAEGDYTKDTMPMEQKKAIVELCKYLCNEYSISEDKIYGHSELLDTECPGAEYPLKEIKDLIIDNEECVDMKKIVTYLGDADLFAAIIVSQKNNCALMRKCDFDNSGIKADEVIQIGGKEGSNRFSTFKDAAELV